MATGTADVAIMIARELAKLETPDSGTVPGTVARVVVGIDPSANMLDVSHGIICITSEFCRGCREVLQRRYTIMK